MKQATILLLIAVLFSCKREVNQTFSVPGFGGRLEEPTHSFPVVMSRGFHQAMLMRGKPIKNRPPKGGTDTTITPIDTTTPPTTDTVIVVDPVPTPSTEVSLTCPPVQNQLYDGPCMSFAACYARDIEQYYKSGASTYSQSTNIFSPHYLYNLVVQKNITENYSYYGDINYCSFGSAMLTNLDMMVSKGVCTWSSMPFNTDCYQLPNATQLAEGYNYRPPGYVGLYTSDIEAVKNQVRNKHAVLFTCSVDNSWINAGPGFIWKTRMGWGPGHGMAVVGFDDSKNAFKVLNSWGTGWCESGYGWIDYGFFATNMGAWCFSL